MKKVKVAEFRSTIAYLEKTISDRHSCVNEKEMERWRDRLRRVRSLLLATECKRSNQDDRERCERALQRSASLLNITNSYTISI